MRMRSTKRRRGMIALALLIGAVPAYSYPHARQAASGNEAGSAPVVVAVRIVGEDGQVLVGSPRGIPLETGKPLDREGVAGSLRALYRTGDYADLRAVVTPENGGVRLDFVVRENLFFNLVRLEGLEAPPSEASAVAAMQIGLGQTYRKEILGEALERLRETLREEGLYRAEVSAETVPHPETHQMDIMVHVKPGPRAHVASIQLTNDTAYREATLLSRFKMKPGQAITSARLQRGTGRVRKFLAKKCRRDFPGSYARAGRRSFREWREVLRRGAQETDPHIPGRSCRPGPARRREAEHPGEVGTSGLFRCRRELQDRHARRERQRLARDAGNHHLYRRTRRQAQTRGHRDLRKQILRHGIAKEPSPGFPGSFRLAGSIQPAACGPRCAIHARPVSGQRFS